MSTKAELKEAIKELSNLLITLQEVGDNRDQYSDDFLDALDENIYDVLNRYSE
jgi:hypothetical protein